MYHRKCCQSSSIDASLLYVLSAHLCLQLSGREGLTEIAGLRDNDGRIRKVGH